MNIRLATVIGITTGCWLLIKKIPSRDSRSFGSEAEGTEFGCRAET
jgi:hypothetical protein